MKHLLTLTLLFSTSVMASIPTMECESTRLASKKVIVSPNMVTYIEEFDQIGSPSRNIASTQTTIRSISSIYKASSVTKTLQFEGHKHVIHISDLNSPNEVEDYLSITSPKGHQVIYPITCHKK